MLHVKNHYYVGLLERQNSGNHRIMHHLNIDLTLLPGEYYWTN